MARSSFPIAHRHVLAYEGGYSNHPSDPGGVTLNGITQAVYDADRRARGLPKKKLTPGMNGLLSWNAERDDIYRRRYWNPPACDALHPGVDAAIYDYAVNSGIGRAAKVLQRLVGVPADGKVDAKTIEAANKRDPKVLVATICDERLAFLKRLKTWRVFGKGWGRRVADVRSYAGALAVSGPIASPAVKPELVGKGEVPEPKKIKTIVKGSGPAAAIEEGARAGAGWADWIWAHPIETVFMAACAGAIVFVTIHLINRWRKARQEAATPGFGVVPEAQKG